MTRKKSYWLLTLIVLIFIAIIGAIYLKSKSYFNPTFYKPQPATTPTITEESINTSGYVISGGDTTPKGLMDAPRKFVYVIKKDDGSLVNVIYTAYPPSPVGDKERKKIRLSFYRGAIGISDYLIARGSYDRNSNTLLVVEEGDYIETYPSKP